MNYAAADVKRLREATAAGMLDCKKALDEAEGDFDKAVEIIRVKGLKGVTKREGRATSNGLVVAKVQNNVGVMLELNCETDFVSKGERFQSLADELLEHLVESNISDLDAFLSSEIKPGRKVQDLVDEANATLGEKIEVRRISILEGPVGIYLHRTSPDLPPQLGVLVQLTKDALECFKFLKALNSLVNRGEVSKHAAEPTLGYIRHSNTCRLLDNWLLCLLLGTNIKNMPALGDHVFYEFIGAINQAQ